MCWAQTVIDKSAPAQKNGQAGAGTSSDSQDSAPTPDFFDESLLLDGFQDSVLGAWDGEPDFLLDQLLKQEVPDVFPTGPLTSASSEKSDKTQPAECFPQKSGSIVSQVAQPIGQQQPMMMHPAMLQPQMQVQPMQQAMPPMMQQLPQQAGFQNGAGGMMQQMQGLAPGQMPPNVAQMQMLAAMMASGGAADSVPMMCGQNSMNMANQMLLLAQQAGMSRGFKTQADLDEAIERVKKKRRESAQRSRARKNCYMKQLEDENKALKDENARLRASLTKFAKPEDMMNSAQVTPVWHQSVNSSTQETGLQMSGSHYMAMVM